MSNFRLPHFVCSDNSENPLSFIKEVNKLFRNSSDQFVENINMDSKSQLIYLLLIFNGTNQIFCEIFKLPFFLKSHENETAAQPERCNNFYKLACNQWLQTNKRPPFEPVWNPIIATSHEINRRLAGILEQNHESAAINQAQIFYRSCKNPANYQTDLRSLIGKLGGWSLIGRNNRSTGFDWLKQIILATKFLRVDAILKIHVGPDYKNPAQHILYMEPGSLVFPEYVLLNPRKYSTEIKAYHKWILETIKHVYYYGDEDKINHVIAERVRQIIRFEIRLARLMSLKSKNERLSITKLTKTFPALRNFENYAKILGNVAINSTVAVRNSGFLKNLAVLIGRTERDVVGDYVTWAVVKDLSRDTSGFLRNLSFLIDRAILGVGSDFERAFECVGKTVEYFSPPLVSPYVKKFLNSESFGKIEEMFLVVKDEFKNFIKNNRWLSEAGKNLATEKVENVKLNLGFPRWNLREDVIGGRYKNVGMTGNYFLNVLKMKKFLADEDFSKYTSAEVQWPSTPFDVNAYYSLLQNSICIFIPMGLFEPPFFHLERPQILNFGALGALIGHELSHSLDPSGILADKDGKINPWLPTQDVQTYKTKINCYDGEDSPQQIGENMADTVGLKISLSAYRNLQKQNTDIEMFFVSFSQMWCEISDQDLDIFFSDEHANSHNRVSEAVNRNREFVERFKCDFNGTWHQFCEIW